jgi:transcriptional regulator with XRE-family HTH domain
MCTVDVMSSLSDRLWEAKGDRTYDDIIRMANRYGYKLSKSALSKYFNDRQGPRPSPQTLDAIAFGLDLDPRELRQLAGMQPGELDEWEPPAEAALLNKEQREVLDSLIKTMVRTSGLGDAMNDLGETTRKVVRNNVTSIQAPLSLSESVQQILQDERLAAKRSSQSKGRPDSDGIPQFTKDEVEEMLATLPDDDVDELWRDYENTKHKERQ